MKSSNLTACSKVQPAKVRSAKGENMKSAGKKCSTDRARRLKELDLPAVLHIEQGAFAKPLALRQIRHLLKRTWCHAVGIERDGVLVGFLVFEVLNESVYVADMAVARTKRRGGVATRLLSWLIAHLPQFRRNRIWLRVETSNKAAIACYSSLGFLHNDEVFFCDEDLCRSHRHLIEMAYHRPTI